MKHINTALLAKALVNEIARLKQIKSGPDLGNAMWDVRMYEEQLALLQVEPTALMMASQGGEHFGIVREWIQRKAINGSDVTWGSSEHLRFSGGPPTVSDMEALACSIAAGAARDRLTPLKHMPEPKLLGEHKP